MNKPRIKDKMGLFLGLGILILCMLCAPAFALGGEYSYEGFPLATNESGFVDGDVYVSCGDNAGLNDSTTWSYKQNTLVTTFTDVPTGNVTWAELKIGVWGGSTSRVGWAETELNGTPLSNETLDKDSLSNNVSCSGSGVYLIQYNCTDLINNTLNQGVIEATVVATPRTDLGTSKRLDSRIYGAVLIVAYDNGGEENTQYWINQGNLNLHKNVTAFPDLDASITWFNGSVDESVGDNATLTVGYFAGDDDQKDYLYFNPRKNANSPYNLTNVNWPILLPENNYSQLDSDNVANETCDELNFATKNFDLHTFSLNVSLIEPDSNYAVFWRGHGNDTGEIEIYDPPYSYPAVVNPNTESYVSPFLAVLKIKS